MVTYTDPVEKQWVMDSAEDFREGTIDGVELDNPNYSGKVVVECLLGDNILDTQERPWNPSFEIEDPAERGKPQHWRFEDPSTGSYYQQEDPEGAFDGNDYVVIRDESNERYQRGRLILDPDGVSPEQLNIVVNPQKTYTVRYHGKYVKAGPGEDRVPVGRVGVKDDAAETEVLEFEPFVAMEATAGTWQEADYRVAPADVEERKVMLLKLFFGGTAVRKSFPELSWAI